MRIAPGCCHRLWDEAWSHCRAPSALLIPRRGEAEPSSWAVGSLPTPAWAIVSARNRGCPLGHCNPTLILLAGCFEVPRLEMLSAAGAAQPPAWPELDAGICLQPFPGLIHPWWTSAPLTASSCCWRPPLLGKHNISSPKERGIDVGCLSLVMHPAGTAPSGHGTQHATHLLCCWHSAALGSCKR